MGQTLSEPVKEKHTVSGHDDRILYASSAMQGWRISMEDAHTAALKLLDKKGYSYFGVYDGHGGQNVAKYSGNFLHARIAKDENFETDLSKAIQAGFLATDNDLKNDPQFQNDPSGCTAVMSIVTPNGDIYVGNAGDSRAVLSEDGESKRIQDAGGFVEFGRVNGNLALSRALGDFEFKQNSNFPAEKQIVTAYPDVKRHKIKLDATEFLVLACDGIWDCLSSQQVVSFIRKNISEHKDLRKACEDLMERCLAKDSELGGIGCDNMTVIIVGFLHGKNEKEWYEWMAGRYGIKGPKYEEEIKQREDSTLNGGDIGDDPTPADDDGLCLDSERTSSSDSFESIPRQSSDKSITSS
ncbi:18171_t:CDS:2 [Gigaspora margarita]|uniref:protein-serine/threonine phosphatase n=1 Tax=Gigaspora margarita TaxID=4874 RepID=A0ABN7VHE4_GIGMA|nr:18171_t:CDS:2 [Gigaspora margarita]